MIKITFPDGAVREFESGVTTFEIAQSISNSPVSYTHLTLPTPYV